LESEQEEEEEEEEEDNKQFMPCIPQRCTFSGKSRL
jgi:hypothetical protein